MFEHHNPVSIASRVGAMLLLAVCLLPTSQAASPKLKPKSAAQVPSADEIELRFFPLPQQRHHIHSVMAMKMDMRLEPSEGMSEEERAKVAQAMQAAKMPLTMRSEFDQQMTTTAIDKQGNFQLLLRGTSLPMEVSNALGERVGPPSTPMDIKIDARLNQKTGSYQAMKLAGLDAAASGMSEGLLNQLLNGMRALEGRRLKVGESAEMPLDMALPIPKTPGMNMTMLGRYTLLKVQDGVADFDVGVTMSMSLSPDAATAAVEASNESAPASEPTPSMNAAGKGQGRMSLRLADRLVLNQQMEMSMKMQMSAAGKPPVQMVLDMNLAATGKNLKR